MRNLLKGFEIAIVMVFLLTLINPLQSVSAATETEPALPATMENDYRDMMKVVKENVMAGKSDQEVAKLPEAIEFQEKYTPEQINHYLTTKVKGFQPGNSDKVDKTIKVGKNDKEIIEYEDGSFSVVESVTKPVATPAAAVSDKYTENSLVTPLASHSGSPGTSYKTTYTKEFWGIYLAARAVLITKYTVYTSKIDIYDTDDAGSKGIFPTTLTLRGTSIVTDNAMTVQSKGNYTKVNGVVIGGQPIGFSHAFTLRTKIYITSATSTTVKFTTSSWYEG
ncbi:hypothetical protein [Bacillus sp. FJAT-47783]|uniref:hypothetical protein n=1 Tax=Bacillus sp. FJAT-47783 TaxID=2922712 RepID=UPI001FAB88CA|nr:hypothetical protein [Bacillus sp. FJAT-47783]